jgi:pyruvate dehydrogenase E1 component beta subunit
MTAPTAVVPGRTYTEAIAAAIRAEMEADESVVLLGEDVARYGGIYGHMAGLHEQFPDRVRDTPISEAGFIGAAAGAATHGVRPIVELMTVDFFGVAMDQIYNYLAKVRYVSNGARHVPMVIMASTGNPLRQGVTHSQTLHGTFAHLPGMKVVTPSTPGDVEALMRAAIRDDDPVLFLFHRALLTLSDLDWDTTPPEVAGIGRAAVRRPGSHITIAALSFMVHQALEAADVLAAEGIDAEVLDLRSLVPLDGAAVEDSVRRTGRLLVLDEDYRNFGMSAEIMAVAIERAGDALQTSPRRLARAQVPIPFSRPLEDAVMLSPPRIADAARATIHAGPRYR